jgi:hypothetical protein
LAPLSCCRTFDSLKACLLGLPLQVSHQLHIRSAHLLKDRPSSHKIFVSVVAANNPPIVFPYRTSCGRCSFEYRKDIAEMAPVALKDLINTDGFSPSGKVISKRRLSQATTASWSAAGLSQEHDLVLKTFRLLIADLCQQFKGGHPG